MSVSATAASANAEGHWGKLEPVDMTTSTQIERDYVVTTGLTNDFDIVAFAEPRLDYAADTDAAKDLLSFAGGWQGLIEVDIDEEETISAAYVPGHADRLRASDAETRMSGFYTMRYSFESTTEFRPYAGAGIGIIAAEDSTRLAGGIAARAVAGFDVEVDENAGFFAEYSYVKSSGTMLAQADTSRTSLTLPDDEHSLKFGFRRTF